MMIGNPTCSTTRRAEVNDVNEGMWGTLLVLAVTAAASPFSLIAFSLVLATDRGPRNGLAFIAGWVTTVVAICAVSLLIGGAASASEGGEPSDVVLGIEIALGAVLLMLWVRRRMRARVGIVDADTPDDAAPPKAEPGWRRRIETMRAPGAFVLGGATQTWPVMIAGGAEIARADISTGEAVAASVVFALLTTAGIVILEVLAWRSPDTAVERLHRIEHYVARRRDTVISWIMLMGGVWLLARGILGLVA
jgi:hypothetical protein